MSIKTPNSHDALLLRLQESAGFLKMLETAVSISKYYFCFSIRIALHMSTYSSANTKIPNAKILLYLRGLVKWFLKNLCDS